MITEQRPLRIGIVGTDNSHVEQVILLLNVEHRLPGVRVVAICSEDSERAAELADLGSVPLTVRSPAEMLGAIDAGIVADRHGDLHARHATPLLDAGLPMFIDKPFALESEDARAMIHAATVSGALLTSYSPLRWAEEVVALRALDGEGPLLSLTVTGAATTVSEYGGIHFYGVHPAEIACQLAPGPIQLLGVERDANTVTIRATMGETRVTLVLVDPGELPPTPFHITAVRRGRVDATPVTLAADYLLPGLIRFIEMIDSGIPPLSADDLLRPVELLSTVRHGLEDSSVGSAARDDG